jgi:signal transduction histidine kinase
MKSIRMSLLVYFLALLAVALGSASLLAYRSAERALEKRKETTKAYIKAQYEERCKKEKSRRDDALLIQAETLARLVSLEVDWRKFGMISAFQRSPNVRLLFGTLGAYTTPYGHLLLSGCVGGSTRHLFDIGEFTKSIGEIQLDTNVLQRQLNEEITEYFQVNSFLLGSYRSKSLGERSLMLNPDTFGLNEVVHFEFDDYQLTRDTIVRQVTLKVSNPEVVSVGRPPPSRFQPGALPPPSQPRGRSAIFIQCAYDIRKLNGQFEEFAAQRDEELNQVEDETNVSLASLRTYLLGVGGGIFAATVLGSFWLVRLGLMPLRRLSHAVSRVSEKDLRFQFHERRLAVELKPIVDRLTETFDQLKRAFAREKKATADISHELRTPLAALLTTTELALRKPRSAEEYREFLQDCQLSGKQMNQAVDRLLTLARLDAGVEVVRSHEVDAAQVAEQCAAVVRPLAEARGLHLSVHRDGETHINTDPDKLREVLTNLLHNAIQYNTPDGSIDVSVARANGHLDLAVSDTGIGIAPEAREHIFERFFRADPSRGTDGLHAGLGLSIVKEFVGLMGGTIAVESTEGKGSTFRVQLPVR